MHKDTNVEKGESYIKSRSREYRNIVLVCMAALIVIVVGIVILVEVFRTEIPKVSVFDENGNEIGIYEDGGEVSFVKNKLMNLFLALHKSCLSNWYRAFSSITTALL